MTAAVRTPAVTVNHNIPAKIIIRGTSKMSLNDRFSQINDDLARQPPAFANGFDRSVNYTDVSLPRVQNIFPVFSKRRKPVYQRLGVKARLGFRNNGVQIPNGNMILPASTSYGYHDGIRYGGRRNNRAQQKRRNANVLKNVTNFKPPASPRRGKQQKFGRQQKPFRQGGKSQIQPKKLTVDELNRQLDEYMSKSKNQLDNDLDICMADADI